MSHTSVTMEAIGNNSTLGNDPTTGSFITSEFDASQAGKLIFAGLACLYVYNTISSLFFGVKAPYVGHRSFFEPAWLVGLRFVRGSGPMIKEGYRKYKNGMFKVRRNDSDILVISNKHVEQLRALPDEKISAIRGHIKNLLGRYSTTLILLESDLHTQVLQQKLTPNLSNTIPVVKDELDFALEVEVPKCDDWLNVQIYEILLRIVARISARVFLGPGACRNEEWLATSIHYTENVFGTVMTLRRAPAILHPILAPLLPSYWGVHANLRTAKRIIGPIVRERRAAAQAGDPHKGEDLLQWMMDAANEHDGQPDKLAHRQLLLSLASIHTTTMAAAHALYDLCAHPQYFEPLREEIIAVLREDGGWKKTTLNKMRKMDSFMKESQRMNPPSLLAFNRIVRSPITLSDGTVLPKGTHFSMASDEVMHDPEFLAGGGDPSEFDPFRYSRLRDESAENANRYQFATTDKNSLHFGHGKYSCPGRFFASNEIKIIMAHLLLRYDFKYPAGQGRPVNLSADENLYPDPTARLLMREAVSVDEGLKKFVGL
ncbi:cytochrome P450 monooxygenase [Xylariaceae sp. FL0594]|nr:cytochrome P450 monooxygenase [Xylariaceae sp. FL0594]